VWTTLDETEMITLVFTQLGEIIGADEDRD